jgi:hypothetical protein
MASARERAAYDRHAVLSWICASGLITRQGGGAWRIEDFHPFAELRPPGGAPITGENIGALRELAEGRSMKVSARDIKVVEA